MQLNNACLVNHIRVLQIFVVHVYEAHFHGKAYSKLGLDSV